MNCKNCGVSSEGREGYGAYEGSKLVEFVCLTCYKNGIKLTAEIKRKKNGTN